MNAIKIGAVVGGAFVLGDLLGGKVADGLNLSADHTWARRGVKIGTGLASYFLLASILG